MKSGVYAITSPSGRRYIGSSVNIAGRWRGHLCDLRARRHHSSVLQKTYDKYGEAGLVFSVLEYCTPEQLLIREQHYIDATPKAERYNVCTTAGNRLGLTHTPEARARMSVTRKGRKLPAEWAAKLAELNRARAQTPEHRERTRQARTGAVMSTEARAKISAARKGKRLSDEHRAALSAAQKGVPKPRTAEHAAKLAAAVSAAKRGVPLSDEHRAKIAAALRGRVVPATTLAKTAATAAARNPTGYAGVYPTANGRFKAVANVKGHPTKCVGTFDTASAAAAAKAAYLEKLNG